MTKTITRTGEGAFVERAEGDTPHSLSVSVTKTGEASFDLKLYFATADDVWDATSAHHPQLTMLLFAITDAIRSAGYSVATPLRPSGAGQEARS